MLASAADRERVIGVLQDSFAEGRLSWAEFDDRAGRALVSRDFTDLAALIRDLPVSPLLRLPAHRATHRTVDERAARRRRAALQRDLERRGVVPVTARNTRYI
jgi:RNA polymerase-interacting CarD/CdnL/TRCF family regulator